MLAAREGMKFPRVLAQVLVSARFFLPRFSFFLLLICFVLFLLLPAAELVLIKVLKVAEGKQRSTTAWPRFCRSWKELARSPKTKRSQGAWSQWEERRGRATPGGAGARSAPCVEPPPLPVPSPPLKAWL